MAIIGKYVEMIDRETPYAEILAGKNMRSADEVVAGGSGCR